MAATQKDLIQWFDEGVELGATHMVVICDTFDYDDFPVYVMPGQDARRVAEEKSSEPLARLMEVFNLSMSKNDQMSSGRAFNY